MGAMLSRFAASLQIGVHNDYEEADNEDEDDDDKEADEQQIQDAPQAAYPIRDPGLGSQRADAVSTQHDSMENRDAQPRTGSEGEEDEGQDGDEEDNEDDEDWEPAPTRTELLQDAVQYLRQASAEHGELDAAAMTQDEEPPQVR